MKTVRVLLVPVLLCAAAFSQQPSTLEQRIQQIISRPEFRHAMFGIEFLSLDSGQPVYALNADKLFTPASTTKLLTEGTALELLGADYRFHTFVYRTGPVAGGVLNGDLVLVASGDPNLSGRIGSDGKLAFTNVDHAYAGSKDTRAVPGDPLAVIREVAQQIAGHGIRQVNGRVLVDATLFPEGDRELGTGVVISPIVVNDNIVDVTISPGAMVGAPVAFQPSPATSYVKFINEAKTGAADSKPDINWTKDTANPDGTHVVTISGNMPLGKPGILFAYPVPQPSRFAEVVLREALAEKGVQVHAPANGPTPDFTALSSKYQPENIVAEHVSAPMSEEVKVTLKVSQNLHASMTPFTLGAVLGHAKKDIEQAGFDQEHDFLQKAGLDLSGASQADGAGGAQSALYTPDFMVHYLAFMAKQKDYQQFHDALPILGKDGTLWNIQTDSPAAGKVHAKTGTFGAYDALNKDLMITGKGLAGYMTAQDGRHLAFAIYANRVAVPLSDPEATTKIVGQAVGAIAAAAYDSPPPK